MPLTDAVANTLLDTLAPLITHYSLHTAYSSSGANEVTGGSPAYARKAATWNSAATRNLDNSNTGTFDVPAATTVAFWGGWSAISAGTFRGMFPLQGATPAPPIPFTAVAGTDVITADAHGYVDTNRVVVWDVGAGGVIPTGLTEGSLYFVRDMSGDTFKLALTSGGTAIDLTTDGGGFIQLIVPETFAAQGTYLLSDVDVAVI